MTSDSSILSAHAYVRQVAARDRFGIVICCLQPCCLCSSISQNIATPRPSQGFLHAILVNFRTEDQDIMSKTLRVRWTITPQIAPQPWIVCSGCGGLKPFRSSGKTRLNANGRKLDAWLIYKCLSCDKTWNRTVFERQNVQDIAPEILEALQSNDPAWIHREAFNLDALRHKTQRIDEFADYEITKAILHTDINWTRLAIELSVAFPSKIRLDRLLAAELKISRTQVLALHKSGALHVSSERQPMLRKPVKSGFVVSFDLPDNHEQNAFRQILTTGAV